MILFYPAPVGTYKLVKSQNKGTGDNGAIGRYETYNYVSHDGVYQTVVFGLIERKDILRWQDDEGNTHEESVITELYLPNCPVFPEGNWTKINSSVKNEKKVVNCIGYTVKPLNQYAEDSTQLPPNGEENTLYLVGPDVFADNSHRNDLIVGDSDYLREGCTYETQDIAYAVWQGKSYYIAL